MGIQPPLEDLILAEDGTPAFVTAVKEAAPVEAPATNTLGRGLAGKSRSLAALDESWQDQIEIHLVAEAKGHKDAVTGMYTTSDPRAVVTCSQDRRVKLWSADTLEACGALLQTIDPAYRFSYNPVAVNHRRLAEAENILNEMIIEEEEAELKQQAILRSRAQLPSLSQSASDTALRGRGTQQVAKRMSSNVEGRRSASQLRRA